VLVVGALVVLSAVVWWENQNPTPAAIVNTAELAQKPAVVPQAAVPVPVVANTQAPVVQASTVTTNTKVAAKKVKHTVVAHHHAEPMHVTYTLKPVSSAELASDH
jgi:hypothetical protein